MRNQYTQRTVPGYADVLGIAVAGTTVSLNGSSAGVERKGEYFRKELTVANTSAAQYPAVEVQVSNSLETSPTESGKLFVPKTPEAFTYDEDGNLKTDGRWTYFWDAENRLTKLESLNPPAGANRRLEFQYDWRGRRV